MAAQGGGTLMYPNLGTHCAEPTCKQLDFLPITCPGCTIVYCKEHAPYEQHRCTNPPVDVRVPVCPLCSATVACVPGDDIDKVINAHIEGGCKTAAPLVPPNHCSVKGCSVHELVPVLCKHCNLNFCFKHRADGDHACTNAPGANAAAKSKPSDARLAKKQSVLKHLFSLREARRGSALSKRVANTRIKARATGNAKVADAKRFYLEVIFPLDSKVAPKYMFFDRNATVGKVLDDAAKAGRIRNRNHVRGAPKLQLVSIERGEPLPTATKLRLLPHTKSGDTVLLEFFGNLHRDKPSGAAATATSAETAPKTTAATTTTAAAMRKPVESAASGARNNPVEVS